MDTGELIALAAILVGILLSTLIFTWQMHFQNTRLEAKIDDQNTRLEAKIDAQGDSLRAEIKAVSNSLEAKIDSVGSGLGEVERSHARLEGINETLSQILRQQSHTHESAD